LLVAVTDGRASGVLARKGIFVFFFSSIQMAFISFYTDESVEVSVMSLKFSIIVEIIQKKCVKETAKEKQLRPAVRVRSAWGADWPN